MYLDISIFFFFSISISLSVLVFLSLFVFLSLTLCRCLSLPLSLSLFLSLSLHLNLSHSLSLSLSISPSFSFTLSLSLSVCPSLLGMWNTSPLMTAIQYDKRDIAHYLLDQIDIDVDHINDYGVTALLLACSGKSATVYYIIFKNKMISILH